MNIYDFLIIIGLILAALAFPAVVAWIVEKINKK